LKPTLLIIDDEPDVVKSVQDLLRYDYRVLGATRPAEGIKILKSEDVQVVMTDQRMPEMTGVELLHIIRDRYPDPIRLLCTGYSDVRTVVEAINQGNVYRYITKPWDPDDLQALIRESVERYDLILERNRLLEDLRKKNEELRAANAELRHADELKTGFIKLASHELRTPLSILLLAINLLNKRSVVLDHRTRELIEHVDSAGARLRHLVDEIVAMLQAGTYEVPLHRHEGHLEALLRQAANDIRPFVEMRGQELVLELPADLNGISVDETKIRDSINHLLLNAIKFTPDGGRIELSAQRRSDHGAEIKVSDNGVGIAPASMDHLFEPFSTAADVEHHTSGRFEFLARGVGLGLSVVKKFVEMHGGTIEANSEMGRGTTMTITLPSRQSPKPQNGKD
jgi:signal transduction histidine kinase